MFTKYHCLLCFPTGYRTTVILIISVSSQKRLEEAVSAASHNWSSIRQAIVTINPDDDRDKETLQYSKAIAIVKSLCQNGNYTRHDEDGNYAGFHSPNFSDADNIDAASTLVSILQGLSQRSANFFLETG